MISVAVQIASLAGNVIPDESVIVLMRSAGTTRGAYDPRSWGFAPLSPVCDTIIIQNFNAFGVLATVTYGIQG